MSLTVSPELRQTAQSAALSAAEFIGCIRNSLPQTWSIIEGLAIRKHSGEAGLIVHAPPSMDDATRGQLLRMMAGTAMRNAVEQHFGLRFAFQNCHAVAVFRPHEESEYQEFASMRAQILAQSPELVDC